MQLHIGTSGYSYKEWKGSFYPKDMKSADMLPHYAERFRAVEINGSYYRLPTAATVKAWAAVVPARFQFAFKAPQSITHFRRLKDCKEPLAEFVKVVAVLKDRLGPLLFGLPPNMKKDTARLREFVSLLPKARRVAFEFRHASWFDEEVFDLLRARNAALCIADADDGVSVPFVSTADWGYLRLRRDNYSAVGLKSWLKQVKKQPWHSAFVFFKHEDTGKGPAMGQQLLQLSR